MSDKKPMDGKVIANLAIRLFIITAIAAALLGVVYAATEAPIAEQVRIKEENGMKAVMAQADEFEVVTEEREGLVGKVVKAKTGGEDTGYVFTVYPSGLGGELTIMVGIDITGTITGVRILSHSETPGLGAKSTEPDFYESYTGKANFPLEVSKSASGDNQIQAITSATITSTAVTNGVNAAYDWYVQNGGAN